ncbi:hypothetical protein SKAU_G00198270 [Synaphobranchus kaupii]|uniref:Chemokine interleukin-8-like domain-containing protein n=1 Tax=Synaphobranchus kaupii TaxID=118154 RepID=A0A9Q1FEV8_SYNKA|nr:hypothetical protein SKAU_G00198270 [Synaphobranchus kaupii]
MQAFVGPMRIVAVVAVILCLTVLGTDGNKAHTCCTEVSRQNITTPILGYRIQLRNPPCVRAVIFMTEEGEKCSHWRESWVFQKVQELERARKRQANIPSQ